MPTFLAEPSTALYAILGVVTLVLGITAARRQRRADAINFGIAAAILLAVFLIDRAVESPREAVVRKVQEMGAASRAKRYDDLFKHVSDAFQYKSLDKAGLRDRARQAEAMGFGGISEYDLARSGFKPVNDTTVEHGFRVKANMQAELHVYVVATFKKEADGEWRLTTFKLYDPVNVSDEKDVPGL